MARRTLPLVIDQLLKLPPINLDGVDYTGEELASIVAVNDYLPEAEGAATPQIIFEVGRLAARAHRLKEEAEMNYRIWRDGQIYALTNSVEEAQKSGFRCATDPGQDSKGKDKPPKCPAVSVVEGWLRTQPQYLVLNQAVIVATETWATLHAALEGAKSRTWAIQVAQREGGIPKTRPGFSEESGAGYEAPPVGDNPSTTYGGGSGDEKASPVIESPPPSKRRGPPPPPPIPAD